MRRLLFLALAALLAPGLTPGLTPGLNAAHADPAAEYDRLRGAMPTLLFGNDVGLHVQLQTEVLKRLEGRWAAVTPLMTDGVTFPDANGLKIVCDKLAFDVAPDGALGLTLTMATKADPYTIQLDYVGGNTYISTVDEAGLMARIFPGKGTDEVEPQILYSTIARANWKGYVNLIPLGDSLVLVQPLASPPEMLVRCP